MITFRELVSVMRDRDWYTISALLIVLAAYFCLNIGQKTLIFIIIATGGVRLLSIENKNDKSEKLNKDTIECWNNMIKEHNETKEPIFYIMHRVLSNLTLSDKYKQIIFDKYETFIKKENDRFKRLSNKPFY